MKKYMLLLIPLSIIVILLFLDPLFRGLWLSFTDYNRIRLPVLNYGENFIELFKDKIFMNSIFNMFVFTVISTIVGGSISYIIYRASIGWNKTVRIIWSVVLILFSLVCLVPVPSSLFSSDTYGFINGMLMNANLIKQPIAFFLTPSFIRFFSLNLTIFSIIGPLYVFFNASKSSTRIKLIIAANIGIIVNLIASFTQINLFGFPSTNYCLHQPTLHIFDYMLIRFEVGYAYTLILATLISMLFISALLSVVAILGSMIKNGPNPLTLTKIVGSAFVVIAFLVSTFTFAVRTSAIFMPLDERFVFPPKLFTDHPTLQNFDMFFQNSYWVQIMIAFIAQTVIGGLVYFVIVLTAGFGFSKILGLKSVLADRVIVFSGLAIALLSSIYAFCIEPVVYYMQLGFYSVVMTPFFIASLFVVAKAIEKKMYASGISAGLMIALLGSFINSNIFPMNESPGLWTLLSRNISGNIVSSYVIIAIINITAIIAAILTACALYDKNNVVAGIESTS